MTLGTFYSEELISLWKACWWGGWGLHGEDYSRELEKVA